jgi:hypothetical protein
MAAAKTVVATTHFSYNANGSEVIVHVGDRFAQNHPAVKRYPEWFAHEHADIKRAS